MSVSERGPGRPAGKTRETLERISLAAAMHREGVSVATIAKVLACEERYVRTLLSEAEAEQAAGEQVAVEQPIAKGDTQLAPPRKLSHRVANCRAWEYADRHPALGLGLVANGFWVRIIVAIHESGDGFRLHIGEPGSRFPTRDDLAALLTGHLHGVDVDIPGWLRDLFRYGRLIDVDGADIAIPFGLGLVPGENARGEMVSRPAAKRPAAADRAQGVMLHMIPGGRDHGTEPPRSTEQKSELLFRDSGSKIPIVDPIVVPNSGSENPIVDPIVVPNLAGAHAATATANAKDSKSLSSSGSKQDCAGDGTTIGVSVPPEGGVSVPPEGSDGTEINLQRSFLAELTAELVALGKIERAANVDDLGFVQAWRDAGDTPDEMREVISIKRRQINGKAIASLGYFDGAMADARDARSRATTTAAQPPGKSKAAPAPAAVLSPSDQALRDQLAGIKHGFPPSLEDFRAGSLFTDWAARWLAVALVWVESGRDSDLKPPDFTLARFGKATFEADLDAVEGVVEEYLTGPDPPPEAAG